MLWSDPADEPPRELRDAQRKLRRGVFLVAVCMVLIMVLIEVL